MTNVWNWPQLRTLVLAATVAVTYTVAASHTALLADPALTVTEADRPALNFDKPEGTRTLDDALSDMAKRLKDYQDQQARGALFLGDFRQPSGTTIGTVVKDTLGKKLREEGVALARPGAKAISLTGDILRADEEEDEKVKVAIECTMTDARGKNLGTFKEKVEVDKRDEVARLLGVTVDLNEAARGVAATPTVSGTTPATRPATTVAAATPIVSRDEALKQAIDEPKVSAKDGQVGATDTSPYRVQILVETSAGQYTPAPVSTDGGVAYVDLKPGATYAINLINNARDHDVGVELFVDGLSTFELTDIPAYRATNKWIVPRGRAFLISGWHKNNTENFKFVVTDTPDSLLAQKFPSRGTSQVGMITAQFYPAWFQSEPTPPVEVPGRVARGGTAQGPAGKTAAREEARVFGYTLLANVTVRYERPPVDLPADVGGTVPAK